MDSLTTAQSRYCLDTALVRLAKILARMAIDFQRVIEQSELR